MRTRRFATFLAIFWLTGMIRLQAQQANVNLDYNPQKNTENLIPFSATLNSPDVRDDRTVTFRVRAPEAKEVLLSGVAVLTAKHKACQGNRGSSPGCFQNLPCRGPLLSLL